MPRAGRQPTLQAQKVQKVQKVQKIRANFMASIWNPNEVYSRYIPCIFHVYVGQLYMPGIYHVYTMDIEFPFSCIYV